MGFFSGMLIFALLIMASSCWPNNKEQQYGIDEKDLDPTVQSTINNIAVPSKISTRYGDLIRLILAVAKH